MSEAINSPRRQPKPAMGRAFIHRWLPAVLLSFAFSDCGAATLPSADAAGSRDHEQLRRYEGAVILSYAQSTFEEFSLPLSALAEVPGESDANWSGLRISPPKGSGSDSSTSGDMEKPTSEDSDCRCEASLVTVTLA